MDQPLVVSATEMGIPTIPNYIIVSATQILPGGPPPGVVPGARQHPARQRGRVLPGLVARREAECALLYRK